MSKVFALIAVAGMAGVAFADGGDYGLLIQDGKVVTGVGDHDEQVIENIGERVFAADMSLVGANWVADEPGIFIEAGSMPDNSGIGFVIESPLMRWDGAGAVDFSSMSSAPITLEFGPNSATSSMFAGDVGGFDILYDADSPTGFDEHWDVLLDSSAGAGIYLMQLRFTVNGFEDSESTWTVFNAGFDEAIHDAAIDYVENVIVPAPGFMGLSACGVLLLSRRRRG
ncbi:MAG: hypothetical protein AB8F26_08745 [Phycisphaerales bacterium]